MLATPLRAATSGRRRAPRCGCAAVLLGARRALRGRSLPARRSPITAPGLLAGLSIGRALAIAGSLGPVGRGPAVDRGGCRPPRIRLVETASLEDDPSREEDSPSGRSAAGAVGAGGVRHPLEDLKLGLAAGAVVTVGGHRDSRLDLISSYPGWPCAKPGARQFSQGGGSARSRGPGPIRGAISVAGTSTRTRRLSSRSSRRRAMATISLRDSGETWVCWLSASIRSSSR